MALMPSLDGLVSALPSAESLLLGAIAVFGVMLVVDYIRERDANEAARRTSRRAVGTTTGFIGAITVGLAAGFDVLAHQLPELLVGALGLGAVAAGVSVPMASAIALLGYIVLAAVRGD